MAKLVFREYGTTEVRDQDGRLVLLIEPMLTVEYIDDEDG